MEVDDPIDQFVKLVASGGAMNGPVELRVELQEMWIVVDCPFDFGVYPLEFVQFLLRDSPGCTTGAIALQERQNIHEFLELGFADVGNVGAPIRADLDEPLVRQLAQRFAHRGAAHVEQSGQFLFLELITGLELPGEDGIADEFVGYFLRCGHVSSLVPCCLIRQLVCRQFQTPP